MKSPRQRAFTILELCIVLVIITIVACLAITTFFSRHEVTLENASKLLEEDLRSAKHSAALRHAPIHVEFSTSEDGYRVFDAKGQPLPNPAGGGPFERRYDFDAVFEGVEIHSLRAGENRSPQQTLTFDANGRPTTGFQIVLEFAEARQLVELLPHTGEIRVHPPHPTAD